MKKEKLLKFNVGDVVQLNRGWKNRIGFVKATDKAWWVIKYHWDVANCIVKQSDVVKIIKRNVVPKKLVKYL